MDKQDQSSALILIVDDEADIVAGLVERLSRAGFSCLTASNAKDALASARQSRPDLIISDINLAGESGLDLCAEVKDEDELADVPVIFLSGAQIPHVVRRAHEAGGTYYLRKPFDPEALMDLVDMALWMPHLVAQKAQA